MADILKETYPGVRIINYTSLTSATKDVLGKHIDFGWNWLGEVRPQVEGGFGYIVGITGSRDVESYKTFAAQGVKGFENTSTNTAIYASKNMSDTKLKEIHDFLQKGCQQQSRGWPSEIHVCGREPENQQRLHVTFLTHSKPLYQKQSLGCTQ
jgi:tripartite-type tricarboxylate transporter receptor subunit TctC